jgi:hypothetical protein
MGGILSAFGGRPGGAAGGDLSGSYPNPVVAQSSAGTFTVENTFTVDGTSNLSSSNLFGVMAFQPGNGTNSAPAANVLTPTFANGVAAQLSDTARDYMVYMECTTAGTTLVVAIGPTSTPANSIITSSTATLGELVSFRLPAGWFVKWSASVAAFANQTAISC